MQRHAGFTLLELLVVMGVVSVLMGLSISYLQRTDPQIVFQSILAGELRAAQLTARSEGAPTEVLLLPGRENEPSTVQARLLQPVVAFHLEPGEPALDEVLRPVLQGEDVPTGRFGHARRPRDGDRGALVSWPVKPTLLDLRDGFVVRLDLWLERRSACTILRLLPAIDLSTDAEGKPRARMRLHGHSGEGTITATAVSELPLPVGRWCTLDVGCDGHGLWITLDGRELARGVADGVPEQEPDGVFECSPSDGAIVGMVDEIRWFVYAFSPPQKLPAELKFEQAYRFAFDQRGEATELPKVRFVNLEGT